MGLKRLRTLVLEIGTGSGVLSFLLRKYLPNDRRVIATDISGEAILCAHNNARRLGPAMNKAIDFVRVSDLFPEDIEGGGATSSKYDLIVCNPPWVPLDIGSNLPSMTRSHNTAVFETEEAEGGLLKRLLAGVSRRLNKGGRLWLLYSDFAWQMGLVDKDSLENGPSGAHHWISKLCASHGLQVYRREDIQATVDVDPKDPFFAVRRDEVVSLYEIGLV